MAHREYHWRLLYSLVLTRGFFAHRQAGFARTHAGSMTSSSSVFFSSFSPHHLLMPHLHYRTPCTMMEWSALLLFMCHGVKCRLVGRNETIEIVPRFLFWKKSVKLRFHFRQQRTREAAFERQLYPPCNVSIAVGMQCNEMVDARCIFVLRLCARKNGVKGR